MQAQTKDVTNTVSGKNDIKELTQILNLCYEEIYSVGERVVSIRMFGKNTNNLELLAGDWGVAGPIIVIKKYIRLILKNIKWLQMLIGIIQMTTLQRKSGDYDYI